MQLFEKDGKTLRDEVDPSTVGPEHPVASISDKELGAGTYSLLVYSPGGSAEATLQIRRVGDNEISGMATQLVIANAVMIQTTCQTSNCQHSVKPDGGDQGPLETYPILSFFGEAGRTYNFTTESILGSDAHAVNGVRLAAHIMPSNARDGHQVWDSAENRIESIMGDWPDEGARRLNLPSETDSFKMYFDQYEDSIKHFSWVVGLARVLSATFGPDIYVTHASTVCSVLAKASTTFGSLVSIVRCVTLNTYQTLRAYNTCDRH
jgi:hypothetical protein